MSWRQITTPRGLICVASPLGGTAPTGAVRSSRRYEPPASRPTVSLRNVRSKPRLPPTSAVDVFVGIIALSLVVVQRANPASDVRVSLLDTHEPYSPASACLTSIAPTGVTMTAV